MSTRGSSCSSTTNCFPRSGFPVTTTGTRRSTAPMKQQAAFDALLAKAEVFYGIPDTRPAALGPAVRANPNLRWVQTMAAGGGAQVKAAGLTEDELARVVFTTSAGVHGGTLAEFAVFGVLAGAKDLPAAAVAAAGQGMAGPVGHEAGQRADRADRRARRDRQRNRPTAQGFGRDGARGQTHGRTRRARRRGAHRRRAARVDRARGRDRDHPARNRRDHRADQPRPAGGRQTRHRGGERRPRDRGRRARAGRGAAVRHGVLGVPGRLRHRATARRLAVVGDAQRARLAAHRGAQPRRGPHGSPNCSPTTYGATSTVRHCATWWTPTTSTDRGSGR